MDFALGSQTSSSDFVRKLYKMLECLSDSKIVRWGNDGDSFVVLETENFTKLILPKHFKHSNFASFVRQLNKYDFHKVRHNTEESGPSPYGPAAWEFKHPDFIMNNKDALENIRRKAPVTRKLPTSATPADDMLVPGHQFDMLSGQLVATQKQVTALQERNTELAIQCSSLTQELVSMKTFILNHEQVLGMVVNAVMSDYDRRSRRQSRTASLFPGSSSDVSGQVSLATTSETLHPSIEEEAPPSPLLHASKLLSEMNVEALMNSQSLDISTSSLLASPLLDLNGGLTNGSGPHSAGSKGTMHFRDFDCLVYPVGANNGIDPMFGDNIHNIPYALPVKPLEPPQNTTCTMTAKQMLESLTWLRTPQVLLVEDDGMCRKIGTKFLEAFHCNITTALDGVEAVTKARSGFHFDLILMDIIMPNLDGVSACHLIRHQGDIHIPVVAMTTNLRVEDINLYYQHGMTDILPKPFTRESLFQLLDKHLPHLRQKSLIKEEDLSAVTLHPPSSPNPPHTPSTWTTINSPTISNHPRVQIGPSVDQFSPLVGGPVMDHHPPSVFNTQSTVSTLGISQNSDQQQIAGQRRPLDTSDEVSSDERIKRQQTGCL